MKDIKFIVESKGDRKFLQDYIQFKFKKEISLDPLCNFLSEYL